MPDPNLLATSVIGDITVFPFLFPCRPRVLIVTDGFLNYISTGSFGLTRFVQALSTASPSPVITLAHRGVHATPANVYGTNYPVISNFKFDGNAPAVTTANFDQIWMFGFDGGPPIAPTEVKKIADFMNAGGGVFSTGDHASLGQAMGGQLPRIRHMREWSSVPMGTEGNPSARDRIDTVINPGPLGLYEFDDQGDEIPQRIFPNYNVTWAGSSWTATIHALLRMPNSAGNRVDSAGFTNDMDVMPDHPHESVCYEVSASAKPAAYNGTYNVAGSNFQEFPNQFGGGPRIGSQIIAFAVSGGRSVRNGIWKPPVNPRMFGIISAFDGHAAAPYAGAPTRPGRVVCDSTWHHFVNVNLDGTGTVNPVRTGLGIGSGAGFLPSVDLQKIYIYYRNMLGWLQPLNRRFCPILWDLVALRFHHSLIEELVEVATFDSPFQFEGLGREAIRAIDAARGRGSAAEAVQGALRAEGRAVAFADSMGEGEEGGESDDDRIVAYVLGKGLAHVAAALPAPNTERLGKLLAGAEHERFEQALGATLATAAGDAIGHVCERTEYRLRRLNAFAPSARKRPKGS